jgi:hypothetical protein
MMMKEVYTYFVFMRRCPSVHEYVPLTLHSLVIARWHLGCVRRWLGNERQPER